MALIKCSECGKDVSENAPACPNCGNPIRISVVHISNSPNQTFKVEPQLTSKAWKKVKIVAGCIMVSAFIFGPALGGSDSTAIFGAILGIFFLGAIIMVVGSVGAWYTDKRTR